MLDLLPINFYIFRICGMWREREDGLIVRFVSFCTRYTIAALIYFCTLSEIIELVRKRNNVEDFTEALFLTMSFVTMCFKYINFFMQQCELRVLLDCFRTDLCQPRDSMERSILKQYSRKAKQTTCIFMSLCQSTGLLILAVPLFTKDKRLPMKVYVPYSIATFLSYVLTYLQQCAALIFGILVNASFDSLVYGLIIHTCGQIELLCYRLTEAFRCLQKNDEKQRHSAIENLAITECVEHHILVYDIISRIQSLFVWTTTSLFMLSLLTVCTSIYQISKKELFSPEFITFIMYLVCVNSQVFIYCWYGNELDLKTKSITHAIYNSNWVIISAKQRKNLCLVMMMSQRGRIISSFGFCALVLNTFTWILKTSYSAFNLLQKV
ncbi:odorant receptor 13a [Monomorium pharaonis]|uniref:odorant receptor 13a n=1 Tax=Monomorium pharaonis TaxID=307658 RepID=UPI00102E2178|nr:odorant receptor 13a [Monomorium pharaonis]